MPRGDLLTAADALEADAQSLDENATEIKTTADLLRGRATSLRILHDELAPPEPPVEPPSDLPVFPGVNPLGIVFGNMTNVPLYAKPTCMLIAGRCGTHSDNPAYRDVRAKGGEVLQYLVATERPNNRVCEKDLDYYIDCATVPLWPYPSSNPGTRCKWPDTKMTDMRAGSKWILYTVSYIEKLMRLGNCDGMFLDAMGARPWNALADWSSWSTEEKNAYTSGCVDLVKRLDAKRKAINPKFLIVNNGTWDRGDGSQIGFEAEKYVDGVMIEHHASTSTYHRKYASKPFGSGKQRRVLIIANNQAEALKWAEVPGVTHVSGQTSDQYKNPTPLYFQPWALDDRGGEGQYEYCQEDRQENDYEREEAPRPRQRRGKDRAERHD